VREWTRPFMRENEIFDLKERIKGQEEGILEWKKGELATWIGEDVLGKLLL